MIAQKFIGDKSFYRRVMVIAVPIMVQNAITNFVSMLDNVMVGQIGTAEMSGVSIVNQLIFVYFLCIFGGLSGAGIFTAQYYGNGDEEGIRHTFRYKLWMGIILTLIAMFLLKCFGTQFISLYLNDGNNSGDIAATLTNGLNYLHIILFGLPAFMMVQVYSGTLRDCGKTIVPMFAGICAVLVNLVLDYILIFGKFGLPALGVAGAAIATVIARYVEFSIVAIWCHTHARELPYIKGIYHTLIVPSPLAKQYFLKGFPLLINESLWAAGMATLTQCYSMRGITVVAALNISNTLNNVLSVFFIALGDAVAIIIGQLLGAGKMKEAKDADNKLIAFGVAAGVFAALLLLIGSSFFPKLYNTSDEVKRLAVLFIFAQAAFTPQIALLHTTYFTLRSGGKTIVTFLFDSVFLWILSAPLAYVLSRFTEVHVLTIFIAVNLADLIKCAIGIRLVHKNVWMNDLSRTEAKGGA